MAILMHHSKAFQIRRPREEMKAYVATSDKCRRQQLLSSIADCANETVTEHTYTCCDVCHSDTPSWAETAIKEGAPKRK